MRYNKSNVKYTDVKETVYSINISEEVKKKCKMLSDETIKGQVLSFFAKRLEKGK